MPNDQVTTQAEAATPVEDYFDQELDADLRRCDYAFAHTIDARLQAATAMAEALRRWEIGTDALEEEFGSPPHPESSGGLEAWMEKVLYGPSRESLAAWQKAQTHD